MQSRLFRFQMSGKLVMGLGAIRELPAAIRGLGKKKALIVTDAGLIRAGIAKRVSDVLDQAGVDYAVFGEVESDPRIEIVTACAGAARDSGADVMIGLGGGSSLDIAKVASIMLTNPGDVRSFLGTDQIPNAGIAKVLIPTTAGTGSEVTPIAVLSDKQAHLKKGVVSEHLYADVALVDPELVAGLPAYITAFTGIDALTHAIEAYTNKYAQPFVDTLALEAIRLIGGDLRRAVANGQDLEARYSMSLGSLYGGMCLGSVNTAAVHALAYPLGGTYDVPHGVANALFLPYVMEFNMMSDMAKFAEIAAAMGEEIDGLSLREAAAASVDAVVALCADVGIVCRMRELSIPEDGIDEMAEAAMRVTRLLGNNPRGIRIDDVRRIYREAY